jgi:hypothetical protein
MHEHGRRAGPARPPRPSRRWWRPRLAGLVGAVLAVALTVAACSGGGKASGVASLGSAGQATSTTNAGGSNAGGQAGYDLRQALVFTRCMRQHGYDLPDPQLEGNNVGLQLPNYQGQRAPKFQAAWQACRRYAPNGGQPQRPSAQERQQALAFARCMRQHGINLPDPQFSGDNIGQQLPSRAEQGSAKFKAAEQACKQYLPNGGQPTPADAQEFQQALAFARCMRQHGINLPDPKITADGIDQSPPARMDLDDPRLQAAEHACHQYGSLPPAKPGGPQRGGGGK